MCPPPVEHMKTKNETDLIETTHAAHAMTRRRDDVRCHEKSGEIAAQRLIEERLAGTKLVVVAIARCRQLVASVATLMKVRNTDKRHHAVGHFAQFGFRHLVKVAAVVSAIDCTLTIP